MHPVFFWQCAARTNRSVKILRTCYFTHGHTSLMIHDKKALINPYRVISVHFCHISTTERAPAAFES